MSESETIHRARNGYLEIEENEELYINRILEGQAPSTNTWKMLAEATKKDEQRKWLAEDIQAGYCHKALTKYTKIFEELMLVKDVIVRGEQLVIPEELQPDVIQLVHEGHTLGYEKTLGLLRESCLFPGM